MALNRNNKITNRRGSEVTRARAMLAYQGMISERDVRDIMYVSIADTLTRGIACIQWYVSVCVNKSL